MPRISKMSNLLLGGMGSSYSQLRGTQGRHDLRETGSRDHVICFLQITSILSNPQIDSYWVSKRLGSKTIFPVNLFHVDLLINTALFSSSNYGQFSTNLMQNKQLSLQETLKYISTCETWRCRIPPPLLSLVWRWWYGALPSHGKESGLAEGVSALLHCEHWVAHLLGPGVHHLCHHHIPVATSLLVRMDGRMDMHLHCSVFRST